MRTNLAESPNAAITRYSVPVSVEAIVIDLDGTLMNTAPELTAAANRMLRDMDYARFRKNCWQATSATHQLAGQACADR